MVWLQVWGPSILAVIVAAAFTWLFNVRLEQQRRRAVRTLVSEEIVSNARALLTLRNDVNRWVEGSQFELERAIAMYRATAYPIRWQRARWDQPDVGVAFTLVELRHISRWYGWLDRLAKLYEWSVGFAQNLDEEPYDTDSDKSYVTVNDVTHGEAVVTQGKVIMEFVDGMFERMPPLPDARLARDPEVALFLRGLRDGKYGEEQFGY